jgi:hypothetical protein
MAMTMQCTTRTGADAFSGYDLNERTGIPGVGRLMIDLVGRVAMPHDKPTTVTTLDCNQ